MEAMPRLAPTPCEIEAGADLEKYCGDQQRFTDAGAIDHAPYLHHGGMGVGADQPEQVISDMKQHVEAEDRRRDSVDDAPASDGRRSLGHRITGEPRPHRERE